jgi:hypothetical protein
MKEWKVRQHLYHRLDNPADFIEYKDTAFSDDVVADIVKYFTEPISKTLVYPAKSYAVAMIYARLLEKYFDEDFLTALDDPSLLYGNDQHFVPYHRSAAIYDAAIIAVSERNAWNVEESDFEQVRTTVECFHREFQIC